MSTSATPTKAQLIARAEELAALLAERAAETERQRRLPDETIDELRAQRPVADRRSLARFGGYGLDFDAIVGGRLRLAYGCGSTGWVYMVSQIHDYQAGMAALRGTGGVLCRPRRDVLVVIRADRDGDAWRGWLAARGFVGLLERRRPRAWHLLGSIVPGIGPVLSIIAREDATIVDDWYVSGLRAPASKTIRLDQPVFVPSYRWIPLAGEGSPEMRDYHGRASYGAPLSSILSFSLCAPLVGIAQAAVDTFAAQAQQRRLPSGSGVHELAAVQIRVAESAAEVDAARTVCRALIAEHAERGQDGDPFTLEDRVRFRRTHAYAARLCVAATNRLFDAAGGHTIYDTTRCSATTATPTPEPTRSRSAGTTTPSSTGVCGSASSRSGSSGERPLLV